MTVWIVTDRRTGKDRVIKDLIEGTITSIYFNPDAAESAAFPTETIWEVEISVNQSESAGASA